MSRLLLQRAICYATAFAGIASVDFPARADVKTTAVRETIEYVTKKFSKEAAAEGTELMAKKIEQLAVKHGDDGLAAVRKVGPQALGLAEKAGAHSDDAVRAMARFGDDGAEWIAKRPKNLELASRYGDDAVEALVKHKEVAEPLVQELGEQGAKALAKIGPQQGRQLAMLASDPATAAIARNPQLLDVVARYGDAGMNFIWKNKGALAVSATLAAFLANPQPFIDGTKDLAQIAGENLVKPLATGIGQGADWTVLGICLVSALALLAVLRSYWRHRTELRRST
ncbi:MAG: hypothetical protein C0483_08720 [Pirellula sp.]|nr:hypothetical protein [Pirellula sp.]